MNESSEGIYITVNQTTFANLLKKHYSKDKVMNLAYTDRPFFAMLKKDQSWGGSTFEIPVIIGNPEGGFSNTFADSYANRGAAGASTGGVNGQVFSLTTTKFYHQVLLNGETIAASKAGGGADVFINAMKATVDGLINAAANKIEQQLFRSTAGYIGRIAAGQDVSSTTITLETASDANVFEVGMVLEASSLATGGSLSAHKRTVTAVNRSPSGGGTVTVDSALNAAGGDWVAGYYLYQDGCATQALAGLGSWLGTSAALFGVTRTTDVTRLSGLSVASAGNYEDTLLDAATYIAEQGGRASHCFVHPRDWNGLVKELGSKSIYNKPLKVGQVGFSSLEINGIGQSISVVPARHCPQGTGYMLDMSTWKLCSRGEPFAIDNDDGNSSIRADASDDIIIRAKGYGQLGCNAPGRNAKITF